MSPIPNLELFSPTPTGGRLKPSHHRLRLAAKALPDALQLIRGAAISSPGFHYLPISPAVKNKGFARLSVVLDCF